ncbi:GFA family protein [Sulfitobacter sp.]|uniref:GFA family protein n=1 Tax=Sulfitobacter sp. TaxID=1903071 RepID=UPI003001187B
MKEIKGRCLCGMVSFEVVNAFDKLQLCSCEQCRQITGSAFASNLFVTADGFLWLSGTEDIVNYQVPGREISKSFCRFCGSGVPWSNADGSKMIIPAGCLSGEPEVSERIRIFAAEQPSWALDFEQANSHAGFSG